MRGAKGVVLAFGAPGKARQAAQLAQRGHARAPAGEDFVGVALVAHVLHQAVFGRVEHVVQRQGQLHRAEVGAEVPAGARDVLQDALAQLDGQLFELRAGELAQVRREMDIFKQ